MSRYIMIRRLRGPAFLLLIGSVALLRQMGLIHRFWCMFLPLLLILFGVIMLAERAALFAEGGYPPYPGTPYPGVPYSSPPQPGAPNPSAATGVSASPGQQTAIVPAHSHDFDKDSNGGQS
jgi:hypothetical protein